MLGTPGETLLDVMIHPLLLYVACQGSQLRMSAFTSDLAPCEPA